LRYMGIENGLDINIFSDLPARTGLGSSSSFTVGFLNSLYAFNAQSKSGMELAQEAIRIEKDILGENVGVQDQLAAAIGGFNHMELSKSGFKVNPVHITQERKSELEKNLVLYYTGISRFATEVLKEQVEKTKEKKIQVELKDIYDMVQSGMEILTNSNIALSEFGKLLNETWTAKKKLSSAISNGDLDEMYNLAMKSGSLGGKLLGAGGGGFFLFYVGQENQIEFRRKMEQFIEIKFNFEEKGTQIIHLSQ
jgi:D-glycero-alpha-D-manno-heptose-7-phosphate kinase